jgi:DNA-binding CsgD family transcriptional regulator
MESEFLRADDQSKKITEIWHDIHAETNDKKAAGKYLQKMEIYNQIARQNQQVIMISNFKKQQLLALSDNFDDIYEYGCSMEDYKKWSLFYFSRSIPFEQIRVMFTISSWFNKVKKQGIEFPDHKQGYCGWEYKTRKTGKTKYLMINQQGLEYSDKGEPLIVLVTVSDVTHLLREKPPFWSTIQLENTTHYCYHSEKSGIHVAELLSPREIEFLRCFESGLELKAISEKMGISYKTADTHRTNILQRTGARNPMAAIELVRRVGLM